VILIDSVAVKNMSWHRIAFLGLLFPALIGAQTLNCDFQGYSALDGLKAEMRSGSLELTWQGERGQTLRATLGVKGGQPLVRELAVEKNGKWFVLGHDLTPEYQVTTGRRRISAQQEAPLRQLGMFTPEIIERQKWFAFWDAPLNVPGHPGSNAAIDLPRKPEEVQRAWATFQVTGCQVSTDGARLEASFPGVSLGLFSGGLRYTVYRGTNLIRQEVIAKTEASSVAYTFAAGLKGFTIAKDTRLVWRDIARGWQHYLFGGHVNSDYVAVKARNRVEVVGNEAGSVAVFPASHKFFFAREVESNLGYNYYRKDSDTTFAVGVRQADREESFKPYGTTDAVWQRRVTQAREFEENFALYNAPPGTLQRMAVYLYLDSGKAEATQQAVMAFTHDDVYKPLPGYQVMVSHFHFHFNEELTDAGTIDHQPQWIPTIKALGINIAALCDFHADSHPTDTGKVRLEEQRVYFEGSARFSDRDFLIIPGEEPDATFGGHYMFLFPKPVYYTHAALRRPGTTQAVADQPYLETIAPYGKVYHTSSPETEARLLNDEHALMWQTHPRTKSSDGYPDAVKDQPHFLSDRFAGASFQSLPVDQSQKRLCEVRCLDLLDDMNNWAGPKYLIAEGDTYTKSPEDETYPQLDVNYVRLEHLPLFSDGWLPVLDALRAGNFFVTSGEVLLHDYSIQGTGDKRAFVVDVEWTWPAEFVELVWGDGKTTDRQIISATSLAPFCSHHYRIPFDASDKKWVRFGAWDSAGNGAFTQPLHLR
jgi:hypothetical protein